MKRKYCQICKKRKRAIEKRVQGAANECVANFCQLRFNESDFPSNPGNLHILFLPDLPELLGNLFGDRTTRENGKTVNPLGSLALWGLPRVCW
jgi:hypothetical protein